jgi:hypothetical protein
VQRSGGDTDSSDRCNDDRALVLSLLAFACCRAERYDADDKSQRSSFQIALAVALAWRGAKK